MRRPGDLPDGLLSVPFGKGCVCVIPERVYVAGLKLGNMLRRREAMEQRTGVTVPAASATEEP